MLVCVQIRKESMVSFPRADGESQEDFETEEYIPIRDADDVDLDSLEQIEGYEKKGWLERTTREKLIQELGSDLISQENKVF